MLLFIAEHFYSCKYGTFLLSSHREREEAGLSKQSVSLWMEIGLRKDKEFKNPYYLDSSYL